MLTISIYDNPLNPCNPFFGKPQAQAVLRFAQAVVVNYDTPRCSLYHSSSQALCSFTRTSPPPSTYEASLPPRLMLLLPLSVVAWSPLVQMMLLCSSRTTTIDGWMYVFILLPPFFRYEYIFPSDWASLRACARSGHTIPPHFSFLIFHF